MSNKRRNSKKNTKFADPFLCFAFFVSLFWLIGWLLIDCCITNVNERGAFGDKFGAVNALFSGLAFAGVLSTLILQKESLQLHDEEFDVMLNTQRRQSFETSLFNMLSLQQEIVRNLSLENYKGRDIFEPLYNSVMICNENYNGVKDAIEKNGNYFLGEIPEITRLDHYFRHLYRIFKFIHYNDFLDNKEKYNYTSIVRSQLSDYELIILYYNCLSENGSEKFKPLIETYAVFKNLRKDLLASVEGNESYSEGAFRFVE